MNCPCAFRKIFFGTLLTAAFVAAAAPAKTEVKTAAPLPKVEKDYNVKGLGKVNVVYTDVQSAPLSLEGLPWLKENKGAYIRSPARLTQAQTNRNIYQRLRHHTSGVVLRFRSDSPVIMLRGELAYNSTMAHMTRVGSAGFDSYCRVDSGKLEYHRSFLPAEAQKDFKIIMGYNSGKGMRDWQINFPLYGGVKFVELGVVEGSKLEAPTPHKIKKPILFYGSSITQGGCASRPGMMYSSLLCRALDAELISLGFSGSAKGEPAMAEAIAELDLAAFVYDYDYNAPNPEHLAKTHEKFFQIIRAKHPDLPVVILSKINGPTSRDTIKRRDIIRKTYENAVAKGDKNVYFLDGCKFFGDVDRYECTVDGTHPNDLGFYRMYQGVLPTLQKILNK